MSINVASLLLGYVIGVLSVLWLQARHKPKARLHPQDWSRHAR